jgi:hypothetical protein
MIKLSKLLLEMATDSIVSKIKPNDRVIMTSKDTIEFSNTPQEPLSRSLRNKPKGLWYAIGTDWIDWVRMEMPEWEQDHLFKLETTNKVPILKSKDDLKRFEEVYLVKHESGMKLIDWYEVSKDYAGIELHLYNDWDHDWTYGWDIRSGCIWNKAGIKGKITKIVE